MPSDADPCAYLLEPHSVMGSSAAFLINNGADFLIGPIAWREIPRLSNHVRIDAAPSPKTSNRRSPLRTLNCSNRADTCNHRPSAVASANAYPNPATSTTAVGGGEKTGPSPVDRRKKGSKHHIIVDAKGTPLAVTVTVANVPDVKQLEPLVDAIPPVRGKPGQPHRRPKEVYADRAYDSEPHRRRLRWRGIRPRICAAEDPHGSGLGKFRWVVERTLSWLPRKRKLRIRTERRVDIHEALTSLGCALICFNVLMASLC